MILKWTLSEELKNTDGDANLLKAAYAPKRATQGSAGFDLYTTKGHSLVNRWISLINTGVHVEIPPNCVGLIVPRSSLGKRGFQLVNTIGVIDSDYRGELIIQARNWKKDDQLTINAGERIAQLILLPAFHIDTEYAEQLSDSERGEGGFGSTGA